MNKDRFLEVLINDAPIRFFEHLVIVLVVMLIAILISLPIGILLSNNRFNKVNKHIINLMNIFQTIPSFAFIAIAMPILGIGIKPAIIVLVLQSILPITKNTMIGILEVEEKIIESARGMGMPNKEILYQVKLPLAMPLIFSGIRTSTILIVSSATLAGFIGAGGLGVIISAGLNMFWKEFIIVGASLGAILALTLDKILMIMGKKLLPWLYYKNK